VNQKIEVEYHDVFEAWMKELINLRKTQLHTLVIERLRSVRCGNLGKHRAVGGKVSELKLDYGPGYRIYYTRCGTDLIFLLCAGDKSEQKKDIKLAKILAKEVRSEKN